MQRINIHTHLAPCPAVLAIQNRYKDFEVLESTQFYSVGLHPWYISTPWENDFDLLVKSSLFENVLAIGETGLDKVCTTDWALQEKVFSKQVQLANEVKKPLIIHCVRAWNEVLRRLKKERVAVPVIFHGFAKNIELAKRIINEGYYLSFGKALEKENVQQILKSIPVDLFFLETDDAVVSIETIYKYAANTLAIDMNSLSLQIEKNAKTVFGSSFTL